MVNIANLLYHLKRESNRKAINRFRLFLKSILTLTTISILFPFLQVGIFAQSLKGKIYISKFNGISGNEKKEFSQNIAERLKSDLKLIGYEVEIIEPMEPNMISQKVQKDAYLYIGGYYTKKEGQNLSIYGQIYDPNTGYLIDAMSMEDEWGKGEFENLKLPEEEIREPDSKIIEKLSKKLVSRIRINPEKKENKENIHQNLVKSPVFKLTDFPIMKDSEVNQTGDVFKFLEDMEVVTATRSKTKIKDAPAAVYVVTADQIKNRGYQTLTDALKDVPGFDFQHTYGVYPNLIHQRGLVGENNRTLVYIDGIPDNNINELAALAGTIQYPLHNVERIEIVSGPASSLYGANAFNGIINIITKDGSTPGNTASVMYGGWESKMRNPGYSLSLSTRGKLGEKENALSYSAGGYFYKSDGPNFGNIGTLDKRGYNKNDPFYYMEKLSCGGVCDPGSSAVGHYWSPTYNNSRTETYNVTAKFQKSGFRFETINWQHLQGQGTFANGTSQIDTKQRGFETKNLDGRNLARGLGILYGVASPLGFTGSQWDFQNNTVMGGYTHNISEKLNLDTEVVVRSTQTLGSSKEEYPNVEGKYAYLRPGDTSASPHYSRPDKSYQADSKLQYNYSSNFSTIVGVSGSYVVATKDYGSNESYKYNNFSLYVQQLYKPIEKLAFTVGYRYDEFTTFGNASSPRISAIYSATPNLTLKFLIGAGFRAPTIKELFSETPQRKPNDSLKPELLQSYEFGIGYKFLNKLYTTAHFYSNKVTNLILEVTTTDNGTRNGKSPRGGYWQQNQNLGEARIFGIEIDNSFFINENWKLNFNYTHNKGYYDKLPSSLPSSPSTAGREGDNYIDDIRTSLYKSVTGIAAIPSRGDIPIIAPNKAYLGLTWNVLPKLSLYGGVNVIDVRRSKATNPVNSIPGYKFFKLNIHWEDAFMQGMFLNLLVNNATNEQFYDPGIRSASGSYYPTMHPLEHRNIWITLGYHF